jgi:hypothetical protein
MISKLFQIVGIALLICSCSKSTEQTESENLDDNTVPSISYTVLSSDTVTGFKISNLQLDTAQKIEGTHGITLSFDVTTRPELFELLKKDHYSSLFVDVNCHTPEGKQYLYRNELFKSPEKKKFIHINRDCFISEPTVRHLEIGIPYRQLEMHEGDKELIISIDAFPAKFLDDSSSLNMKMLNGISNQSMGHSQLKFHIHAPELYKASITVLKAKINTQLKKAEKYDVALTGSGYPDLFWEVYCGNDYIYNSPVEKNKSEYVKKCTTPTLYCCLNDQINLGLVDYDNGPFNTQDDIVGIYKFTPSEIKSSQTDTLKFDKVEYMLIQSKLEKAY